MFKVFYQSRSTPEIPPLLVLKCIIVLILFLYFFFVMGNGCSNYVTHYRQSNNMIEELESSP